MIRFRPALILALLGSLAAAAPVAAQDMTQGDVVTRAVDDYIVPAYQRLEGATAELADRAERYCAAPDADDRQALETAYRETLAAWAGVDFFRFGPMARDGRYERFAFWPDVHGTGARQLRRLLAEDDEALLEPGALAEQSAAIQGLPALESLLYSGSDALMETEEPEPYRCALAQAVAENMHEIAQSGLAGWTSGADWKRLMEEPGEDNPVYRTDKEAVTEILKAITTGLEQMREHRLMPPLGASPQEAVPGRGPYARSGQTLAYLRASAAAIEDFVETSGILDLIPDDQEWMAGSIRFEFANLKGALADAGDDLDAAVYEDGKRGKLTYAAVVLTSLRDLFQRQLSPAAGITTGFNSLDGD